MSKRKNREAREREADRQMRRDPNYIAGALASGVPAAPDTSDHTLLEGSSK